jgi:hypothetical protein
MKIGFEVHKKKICVIVKGNRQIVTENFQEANKLYEFLISLLKKSNHSTVIKWADEASTTAELLCDAQTIIAHSQGASRVGKWFSDEIFPFVKTIILIDPDSKYLNNWNLIRKRKIIIISAQTNHLNHYNNLDDLVIINDNHFFNKSLHLIKDLIEEAI